MSDLTEKQARFVAEYLIDLNATQAAIRAGYSPRRANTAGSRLLEDSRVIAAIDAHKIARSQRTDIDADWVLQRLAKEADADLADLYDDENNLIPVEDWPLIWRQGLVTGVDIEVLFEGEGDKRKEVGRVKKLRLSDRIRRLELIGKHVRVNAFQETIHHKGFEGLADRLARAAGRLSTIDETAVSVAIAVEISPQTPAPPSVREGPASLLPGSLNYVDDPTGGKAQASKPAPAAYRPILPLPSPNKTAVAKGFDPKRYGNTDERND